MDPRDPSTWYPPEKMALRRTELSYNAGMVELYHHQLLWDARQSPRVHGAFADVWGTPELWVSIDRVNLNLPPEPGFAFKGFMHYDYDPDGAADPVGPRRSQARGGRGRPLRAGAGPASPRRAGRPSGFRPS